MNKEILGIGIAMVLCWLILVEINNRHHQSELALLLEIVEQSNKIERKIDAKK